MWESFGQGAGASIISGAASLAGGIMANAQSVEAAREQMAFQERMRATQYQTAVKDLQAAGLNPMLAYSQGGAGVPSGAMANIKDSIGPAVSSAVQAYQAKAAVDNTTADTVNKEASTKLINSNVANTDMETQLKSANVVLSNAQTAKVRAEMEESLGRKDLNSTQRQRIQQDIDNIDVQLAAVKAATQRDIATAGQSVAQTDLANANAANVRQDTQFRTYALPGLVNEAEAEKSFQGDVRQVAKTLTGGANAISSAADLVRPRKRGMSIQQNNIHRKD